MKHLKSVCDLTPSGAAGGEQSRLHSGDRSVSKSQRLGGQDPT